MQITRKIKYGKRGRESLSVTFTEYDLTDEEKAVPRAYWPTLLEVKAEKQIILKMKGLGSLHKNPTENARLAKEMAADLDILHNALLTLR